MKPTRLLLLAITGLVIFFFFINDRKQKINKAALEDLDLKLSGVVTNVVTMEGQNAFGITTVKIIQSNIKQYNPRDSMEFYYCVIQDSIAEIYNHVTKEAIGDTINIDTKKKQISWGSLWNEKTIEPIELNTSKNYYDFIKRTTVLNK